MMLSVPKTFGLGIISKIARLTSSQLCTRLASTDGNPCGPTVSKCGLVLNEYPCGKPPKTYVPEPKKKKARLVSMWKIEGCEPDICEMDLRYDMKYYSISDKKKRKYQVTWNECPRLLIKPKKVCLYERIKRPEIKRRARKPVQGSPPAGDCKPPVDKCGCVYIKNVCCKEGRKPPKCKSAFPAGGKCKKRLAPYPSFSECLKDPPIPEPPTECKCLNMIALCDAWAVLRRRVARGLKPIKICGEA